MKGDIRDYIRLLSATRGVHAVIHTAAIVDYTDIVPFRDMKTVNVTGTENVLKACCTLSIPYVVYTSSIAAVGPNILQEPILRLTRLPLWNCPNTVYGEKNLFLKDLYTFARAKGGVLDYMEPEDTEGNCTYVGNVAWMLVLATQNLQLKPDSLVGRCIIPVMTPQ